MSTNLHVIKNRIKALDKTSTITKALYNISYSKIKSTTEARDHYFRFMTQLKTVLFDAGSRVSSHPLIENRNINQTVFILITADRGLVGGYHNQLFKYFLEQIKDFKKNEFYVLAIGRKGFYFAKKHDLPLINEVPLSNNDDLQTNYFRKETRIIQDLYLNDLVGSVKVFYMHYVSTNNQKVRSETILPIPISKLSVELRQRKPYFYDTKPVVVLEDLSLMYIESSIYGALVDGKLSEHAARVVAMQNATDNAKGAKDKLQLTYNRVRQQAITNELIDLVNGTNR